MEEYSPDRESSGFFVTSNRTNTSQGEKGSDYIIGEINNHPTDSSKIIGSNTAKTLLGYQEEGIKIDTIENIENHLNDVIFSCQFSSKRMGQDELTGEFYDSEDEDDEKCDFVVSRKIDGAGLFFRFPGGYVHYHPKNDILFSCLNIEFMILKMCIPLNHTNIDISKKYKVKRKSGIIQDCSIVNNSALRKSRTLDKIVIQLEFCDKCGGFLEKAVPFDEFLELNNIDNFKINRKTINLSEYTIPENYIISPKLLSELIEHYNTKLNNFYDSQLCDYSEYINE
jgi:hypothetical protein